MTEALSTAVPEWDTADRMRKALRVAGVGVQEMADYLGVDRSTVSTWINGRINPSAQTIRLWALRTGVPREWLRDGIVTLDDRDPDDPATSDTSTKGAPNVSWLPMSRHLSVVSDTFAEVIDDLAKVS